MAKAAKLGSRGTLFLQGPKCDVHWISTGVWHQWKGYTAYITKQVTENFLACAHGHGDVTKERMGDTCRLITFESLLVQSKTKRPTTSPNVPHRMTLVSEKNNVVIFLTSDMSDFYDVVSDF